MMTRKVFTRKNKKCYTYLPIAHNRSSLSTGHQTVLIKNYYCHYCYYLMASGKGRSNI